MLIEKDTILLDLVEKYPNMEDYLRNLDKNSCILCYNLFDTLGDIAIKLNIDIKEFLKELNCHIGG